MRGLQISSIFRRVTRLIAFDVQYHRINIGNAVIDGLEKYLKLRVTDYNTALTVFFVPYALFEIPSNILLRILRPRIWLPIWLFCFGLVTTLQGLVKNYGGLIATRFFLGLTEAGVFPG